MTVWRSHSTHRHPCWPGDTQVLRWAVGRWHTTGFCIKHLAHPVPQQKLPEQSLAQDVAQRGIYEFILSAGRSAAAFPSKWCSVVGGCQCLHQGTRRSLKSQGNFAGKYPFFFFPLFLFFLNDRKEQFTVPAFLQVSILEVTAASGWRRSGAKPVCEGRMRPRAGSERRHSLQVSAANPQELHWERDSSHHPGLSLTMTFEIIFKDF